MSDSEKAKEESQGQDLGSRIKALGAGTRDIKKYTQQIWLAGLGAFARAEEEGGKFFENLVDLGREVEEKTRSQTQSRVEEMKDKVRARTNDTMEKMEKAFDDRLNNALSRLGIPTRNEVENLNSKINDLTSAIKGMTPEEEKEKEKKSWRKK